MLSNRNSLALCKNATHKKQNTMTKPKPDTSHIEMKWKQTKAFTMHAHQTVAKLKVNRFIRHKSYM